MITGPISQCWVSTELKFSSRHRNNSSTSPHGSQLAQFAFRPDKVFLLVRSMSYVHNMFWVLSRWLPTHPKDVPVRGCAREQKLPRENNFKEE